MFSQIFLFILVFIINDQYFVAAATKGEHNCNKADVCLPGAEDIAVHPRSITATSTCGAHPLYKDYLEGDVTSTCDNSSSQYSHPAHFMIDRSNLTTSTWWQSPTLWEWRQRQDVSSFDLPVNITLSFNKSYVITGEIRVLFRSRRPSKMVIEKSVDFGETWKPLQFIAKDCLKSYSMKPSAQNCSVDQILCTEKFSNDNPGSLYFSFLNCYSKDTFWDKKTQELTNATDLRLRLEVPYLDGKEVTGQKSSLNQYFYAISDFQVFGRCQCNGHAPNCEFSRDDGTNQFLNTPRCLCKHKTTGIDCEKCQPLYNNKTWMPATSSDKPNECEKCECYNHAGSCVFNNSLGHGVCENCQHNTTGYFCHQCEDKFYRNFTKLLDDSDVCLYCDCAVEGIANDGSCSQEQSTAGQCVCRQNVTGRRCDRCNDTYYGYAVPPNIGSCVACQCNMYGTENGNLNCNQTTGQCTCKPNIALRTCSQCKVGHYSFPNSTQADCLECSCDSGGSTEDICEKTQGKCLCRNGVQGSTCSDVTNNRFFPQFDYFLFEAEYQAGNYTLISNITAFNTYFTGQGHAKITENGFIVFNMSVDVDGNYSLVLRYSRAFGALKIEIEGNSASRCPNISKRIKAKDLLSDDQGVAWTTNDTLMLCSNTNYFVRVSKDGPVNNLSVSVDSLVLLPKLDHLRAFNEMEPLNIGTCLSDFTTIQGGIGSLSTCRNVTFSNMVELFNGSLACKCSPIGSKNESCERYGGQCPCQPGVMGRTCDRCIPGYYNLTSDGCTSCECSVIGTKELSVCDPVSGQCHCKHSVERRTCSSCVINYYGINTGKGCTPCNCNETGAKNGTCDVDSGKCYCKPGVEDKTTDKCDRCKENFFNFTGAGCQDCKCDKSGSRSLQCHATSGECACKDNTNYTKCDSCIPGTFGLEESNPSGCTPCFCFNRSQNCSSAPDFVLTSIEERNLIMTPDGSMSLPRTFTGKQLRSYGRWFEVNLTGDSTIRVYPKLNLTGSQGNAIFNLTSCQLNETGRYCVQLHEKFAEDPTLSAHELQSILVDLKHVVLKITGGKIANISSVAMGTANLSGGNQAVHNKAIHVEQCDCPENYQSLSCGLCKADGFTRAVKLNSSLAETSRPFTSCVLCSCNNRSKKCDPESRVCKDCRLSEGDSCQTCSHGVDITTGCTRCLPGFWSENINKYGCQACNCVLNNTINHNSSICNVTTGQCSCESYAQGGRRCERCSDNYFNTSHGCKECPECYGLLQKHFKILLEARKTLQDVVEKEFDSDRYQKFGLKLTQAKHNVSLIAKIANDTTNQDKNELNNTLDAFKLLSSNISTLMDNVDEVKSGKSKLETFLTRTENFTREAYSLLKKNNLSLSVAKNLTKIIHKLLLTLSETKTNLIQLNRTLWNISRNSAITSSTFLLKEVSEVANNMSSARDNLLRHTVDTVPQLQNTSRLVSNDAKLTKNDSSNHLRKVDNFLSDSESVLENGHQLAAVIEQNKNRVKNLSLDKVKNYVDLEKNASGVVKDVDSTIFNANKTLNDSRNLLTDATNEQSQAKKARDSAQTTLKDANRTLTVLKHFHNLSQNAEIKASDSFAEVVDANTSIWRSIKSESKAVKDALSIANASARMAKEANNLTRTENQAVSSVYKDNENKLIKEQSLMVCSRSLIEEFKKNVFKRLASLKTCPRNETSKIMNSSSSILSQSKKTMNEVINKKNEVKNISERITKTKKDLKNANITSTVKDRMEKQQQTFDKLKKVLTKLREAKDEKAAYIKQLKTKLKTLKSEIEDLVSLRDSLKDVPPCPSK